MLEKRLYDTLRNLEPARRFLGEVEAAIDEAFEIAEKLFLFEEGNPFSSEERERLLEVFAALRNGPPAIDAGRLAAFGEKIIEIYFATFALNADLEEKLT